MANNLLIDMPVPGLPSLGDLAHAHAYQAPIALGNTSLELHLERLRMMWKIRLAEEKIGEASAARLVNCPVHLGIGQEAIAVGVSSQLNRSDKVFGAHRSHAHFLALGAPLEELFAEVLGRASGASGGMGGSMHLIATESGFMGSVPIVAATISLAVGAGLAARMDGKAAVSVVYFGDGACEEGILHESLNLAKMLRVPVVFVAENNLFSSHLHIDLRQPSNCLARFAQAHGIVCQTIDGNDVEQVVQASARLVEKARAGEPVFLELVTYRWRGHVGPREDMDVGVRRKTDLISWKKRDSIARLESALILSGVCTQAQILSLKNAVDEEVQLAWTTALKAPLAAQNMTLDAVFGQSKESATL